MAERCLYNNEQEPTFPSQAMMRLDWLPEFLASHITTSGSRRTSPNIAPLLDTILVFTRARTSALHGLEHWGICRALATRLNSVLASIGASHHRIELVRRGPAQFFITCTHSPRFSWDFKLTHRVIGLNLDFFAPGHITKAPRPPRGRILFVEQQTLKVLTEELVVLSALDNPGVLEEMKTFNDTKELLFNESMIMLGLPYRFKWIFNSAAARDTVAERMKSSQPPSLEWWESNCYFVNGFGFPELCQEGMPFCSFASHYVEWWPVIQATFEFILTYKRNELWCAGPTNGLPYWDAMSDLFKEIRNSTEAISDATQIILVANSFNLRLNSLADLARASQTGDLEYQYPEPMLSFRQSCHVCMQWWSIKFRFIWEILKMYIFERYKLREPLVREGIWTPSNTAGDELLFCYGSIRTQR